MLITPIQLVDEPLQIDETIAPGALDYAPDIRQLAPCPSKARPTSSSNTAAPPHINDIRLRAGYRAIRDPLCPLHRTRPLRSPATSTSSSAPPAPNADPGEHAITEDETEIGYYQESGLLLEDVVREQVLLSLPSRTLCKPDCKGLCPRCGQNLNLAKCSCDEAPADPRWNALAGLADKLELKH